MLDGTTFFVSGRSGDCCGRDEGLFYRDVRHLSSWDLLVDGAPLKVLTARTTTYHHAWVFGTLTTARVGENPPLTIRRERVVSGGVHEHVGVDNNSGQPQVVRLDLRVAADFADLFDVKEGCASHGVVEVERGDASLRLDYLYRGYRRSTHIHLSQPWSVGESGFSIRIELQPHEQWRTCVDIELGAQGRAVTRAPACGDLGDFSAHMPLSLDAWMRRAPRVHCDVAGVSATYRQSLLDLAALRVRVDEVPDAALPAAGLPWFMALFGRDSLIAGYQALPFQPQLAQSALRALAAVQARVRDDERDADPGKIVHEVRLGERAALGGTPSPYYGSHDSTALFCIVLDEYERWTGDKELVRALEPAARAALAWIRGSGDIDGDGYLEYQTRSAHGLVNQSWKDSWNSMRFADGRMATLPIATCEIQGYAYDARVRLARLARTVWDDPMLAEALDREAAALKERFNRDFYSHERGHYVLALDGEKRQVDALTSNTGQLLWSGIVSDERAAEVVARLMRADMHTGWGVRTMSSKDEAYNPIEYHNGTVWPHDTGLIAEGMRRYGFRTEASTLAFEVLEAAAQFNHRLPEVFAGLDRTETGIVVEYPTACAPQAWSAGAPLLALRTLLGMDALNGVVRQRPMLPPEITMLHVSGLTPSQTLPTASESSSTQ